jgi:hypothetical protein
MNFDTHIWLLDYLSARRLALRRACVTDTALGQTKDEEYRYVGIANELPAAVGLLDEDAEKAAPIVDLGFNGKGTRAYHSSGTTRSYVDCRRHLR